VPERVGDQCRGHFELPSRGGDLLRCLALDRSRLADQPALELGAVALEQLSGAAHHVHPLGGRQCGPLRLRRGCGRGGSGYRGGIGCADGPAHLPRRGLYGLDRRGSVHPAVAEDPARPPLVVQECLDGSGVGRRGGGVLGGRAHQIAPLRSLEVAGI
jgi:hypothetical protein